MGQILPGSGPPQSPGRMESDHVKPKQSRNGRRSPPVLIIIGQDIFHDNAGGDPCADGAAAYTPNVPSGLLPPGSPPTTTVSYYCPPSFQVPAKYDTINCNDIGDTVSEAMDFLGATIVHEWTHNDAIGIAATGLTSQTSTDWMAMVPPPSAIF